MDLDKKAKELGMLRSGIPIDVNVYKWVENFCTNCWTAEHRFIGGGSWAPDCCKCRCENTINWKDMNDEQKERAIRKYIKETG